MFSDQWGFYPEFLAMGVFTSDAGHLLKEKVGEWNTPGVEVVVSQGY